EVDDELTSITVMDSSWALGNMPIPKGEKDVTFSSEYEPAPLYASGREIEIVGVNLHMHERGKSGVVGLKRKEGAEDCLVQVDDYDHQWQGDYTFKKSLFIEPGDKAYV